MLFNLDKQSKKNILEQFKKEALISSLRKIEQRQKEKEEDKYNLEQKEIRQNKIIELINKEKFAKREKLKFEYNLMLQRTKGFIPKKKQLILKNWGHKKDPFVFPNLYSDNSRIDKYKENMFLSNDINNNNFEKLTQNQKEKEILKQVDHMNGYLTDKFNEKEMIQYFQKRKQNRHNFYRELLFSQYQDAINKNFNLYGTNDELIIKQKKRKNLTVNPYKLKNSYDFGVSSLIHNPIVNPENNYNYNKYIDYQKYRLNPDYSRNRNIKNIFKLNSEDNLKHNENIDNYGNKDINKYNRNNWNNKLSENHTIDLHYQKDFNINERIPFKITKYKLNILNNNNYNYENTSKIKKCLSQTDIYPAI